MGDVVKRFICFELWWPFCSAEQNHFCKRVTQEHSCRIISKSINRFRKRCLLSKLLTDAWQSTPFFYFSSGGHFVQRSQTVLAFFGKVALEKLFSEIILKSGPWPRRRCRLNWFSIFSSGGHFVLRSGIFLAGKGAWEEHFCETILKSGYWPGRRCCLKVFLLFFLALAAILFSGAEPFRQFW